MNFCSCWAMYDFKTSLIPVLSMTLFFIHVRYSWSYLRFKDDIWDTSSISSPTSRGYLWWICNFFESSGYDMEKYMVVSLRYKYWFNYFYYFSMVAFTTLMGARFGLFTLFTPYGLMSAYLCRDIYVLLIIIILSVTFSNWRIITGLAFFFDLAYLFYIFIKYILWFRSID